jgi:transposase
MDDEGMAAPRGGIDRQVLTALVEEGLTTRQIAERVDRCQATVRHWLRQYGLRTKHRRRRLVASDKYTVQECANHGRVEFVLEGRGYYRCVRCRSEQVAAHRRRAKATLVKEAGGGCSVCGYDRYLGALHFHHVDPEKKSFSLADLGITRSLEAMRSEIRKCVLLCANCHAEIEGGLITATLD